MCCVCIFICICVCVYIAVICVGSESYGCYYLVGEVGGWCDGGGGAKGGVYGASDCAASVVVGGVFGEAGV